MLRKTQRINRGLTTVMSYTVFYFILVFCACVWSGVAAHWAYKAWTKSSHNTHRIDKLEISVTDLWQILHKPDNEDK